MKANKLDLQAILELNISEYWQTRSNWENTSQYERWETASWWGDPLLLEWHVSNLKACNGGILTKSIEGRIVGELDYCISLDPHFVDKTRAHIIWMLVHPDYRGRGIAKELLNQLKSMLDIPIFVEAEDERSDRLYQKYSKASHSISNWIANTYQSTSEINFEIFDLEHLTTVLKEGWINLLGRYYTPCFDLAQLINSDPVHEFIWGNTPKAKVYRYTQHSTEAYVVMTQYPRFYVKPDWQTDDLIKIVKQATNDILDMGFDTIYLQIYNINELDSILSRAGYVCTIEKDPVYILRS